MTIYAAASTGKNMIIEAAKQYREVVRSEWWKFMRSIEAAAERDAAVARLIEAARAVVERWHTPEWADSINTATLIADLHTALLEMNPQVRCALSDPALPGAAKGEQDKCCAWAGTDECNCTPGVTPNCILPTPPQPSGESAEEAAKRFARQVVQWKPQMNCAWFYHESGKHGGQVLNQASALDAARSYVGERLAAEFAARDSAQQARHAAEVAEVTTQRDAYVEFYKGKCDQLEVCRQQLAAKDAEISKLKACYDMVCDDRPESRLAAAVEERDRLREALREIADEKVHKRYIQSILAVSPDCDRGCLWAEAVESIESFARAALAKPDGQRDVRIVEVKQEDRP